MIQNTKIDTKCQFLYSLNPQIANLKYQFVDSEYKNSVPAKDA